jgi:trans-aconitate 2-methyltransferase
MGETIAPQVWQSGGMELLEWNARSYDSLPLPHLRWGEGVLGQLDLAGDETVADIGCGTGRDAERLLDLLPRGRVVVVDGSEQMLTRMRARLADRLDRVEVVRADLREPLVLPRQVDAAISVATLHWLPDHSVVFGSVARALRPGGRFVAEAGGFGNIAKVRAILDDLGVDDGSGAWQFAGADETRDRLAEAGFEQIDVRVVPDPARLQPGAQIEEFLATVVLGAVLREMPDPERQPFVHTVAQRLDEPVIDYVRLQLSATRT